MAARTCGGGSSRPLGTWGVSQSQVGLIQSHNTAVVVAGTPGRDLHSTECNNPVAGASKIRRTKRDVDTETYPSKDQLGALIFL